MIPAQRYPRLGRVPIAILIGLQVLFVACMASVLAYTKPVNSSATSQRVCPPLWQGAKRVV